MTSEFFWQHLHYAYFTSERNSFLETLCLVALIPYHLTWNSPRVSPHRCQSVPSVNQMRCDMQVDGPSTHNGLLDPQTCAHKITNKSQSAATLPYHCRVLRALSSDIQTADLCASWKMGLRYLCLCKKKTSLQGQFLQNGPSYFGVLLSFT